jgi:hypothetical protein
MDWRMTADDAHGTTFSGSMTDGHRMREEVRLRRTRAVGGCLAVASFLLANATVATLLDANLAPLAGLRAVREQPLTIVWLVAGGFPAAKIGAANAMLVARDPLLLAPVRGAVLGLFAFWIGSALAFIFPALVHPFALLYLLFFLVAGAIPAAAAGALWGLVLRLLGGGRGA